LLPSPAQYLLRFDDLCPTVSRKRFERFLPLIEQFGIRPILAVIPDNRDYKLQVSPPDPGFWDRIRAMEAAGATVALHGYQHLCGSWGGSLLKLHRRTEFAGVDPEIQRRWIHTGLQILRGHGLSPKLWVAPRHGFDRNTLFALRTEGIKALSDGFARQPVIRDGITWIPQQLWGPVKKSKGLWTICVHTNTAHSSLIEQLSRFLRQYAAQFTSVDRVLAEGWPAKLTLNERIYESWAMWRAKAKHDMKRMRRHSEGAAGR